MGLLENKVPPPLVFLLVAAAMWLFAGYGPRIGLDGGVRWILIAAFFALSLVGPLAIIQFLRAQTTVDPVNIANASVLVTSGAFSVTRNPMYLAMALLLCGWAVFLNALWPWAGPAFFVLFVTIFQIWPEERVMAEKFGAAFGAYRNRVSRWI